MNDRPISTRIPVPPPPSAPQPRASSPAPEPPAPAPSDPPPSAEQPRAEAPSSSNGADDGAHEPTSEALVALEKEAPSLASAYSVSNLDQSADRALLDLTDLPPWPGDNGARHGHGIGEELAGRLGHGVAPGEVLAVGAAHAGAGKTAFVMQIADGLALRCAEHTGGLLTPIFILSEMADEALTYRSLARWTGHPAYLLRGGKTTLERQPRETLAARAAARDALASGTMLERSRHYMRRLDATRALAAGGKLADLIERHVNTWREALARKHSTADVVPVLVVDPLQRWQTAGDEIASLNQLVTDICNKTAANKWVAIFTSDTNKASAKGENANDNPVAEGAAVFRGSYNLIHQADAVLYLRPASGVEDPDHAIIEAVPVKARWGKVGGDAPAFLWRKENGRFYAMTSDEMKERRAKAAQAAQAPSAKGRKRASDPPAPTDDEDDDDGGPGMPAQFRR